MGERAVFCRRLATCLAISSRVGFRRDKKGSGFFDATEQRSLTPFRLPKIGRFTIQHVKCRQNLISADGRLFYDVDYRTVFVAPTSDSPTTDEANRDHNFNSVRALVARIFARAASGSVS